MSTENKTSEMVKAWAEALRNAKSYKNGKEVLLPETTVLLQEMLFNGEYIVEKYQRMEAALISIKYSAEIPTDEWERKGALNEIIVESERVLAFDPLSQLSKWATIP